MAEPDAAVIDALYDGVFDTAAFGRALEMLATSFGCVSTAMIAVDARTPAANVLSVSGAFAELLGTYVANFAVLDPAPAAFVRLPAGTASTTSRMLTQDDLDGVFVNEFFRPAGLVETLGGNLSAETSRTAIFGLHRGHNRPAFEDEEIAHVERLMPHIRRVLQLRRAFADLQTTAAGLAETVDRLAAGVVILDQTGRASFVNRAMRNIAVSGDGLTLDRNGRPLPASSEARQRLDLLIDSARRGGEGGTLAAPRRSGRAYSLLVAPWTGTRPIVSGKAGVVILVHDPAERPAGAAAVLKESLGLTTGAAKLVAGLAGEDDLQSYAAREGISINTARFHLRTALARTGTRTQAGLVRLAVRLLRDLGIPAGKA